MELNRIIIFVANVEKCAKFYQDIFGFTVKPGSTPEWVELDTGGCVLALHQARKNGAKTSTRTGSAANPHKIVFSTKDVAKTREDLIAKGVKMGSIMKFEKLVFCDGTDPEGHKFQVSNRP